MTGRSLGRSGDLLICILVVFAIPQIARLIANALSPYLVFIDPDGAFLWDTVHHLSLLLLTLAVALGLGVRTRALGFTTRKHDASLTLLNSFLLYFILFVMAGYLVLYFTSPAPVWPHPLTPLNVAGELGFKALLSGTAEEPLFRGLVMTLLFRAWTGQSKLLGIRISHAGLIATALFVIAQVGFSVDPLKITEISPTQLAQAGILGLFYAVAFDRTRSLLTPILAHNFANTFLTAVGIIWSAIG